ncbi:hypothetical protein COE51_06225 [Bacillus pseudomycoides]|nr:hypothetical protein COE51_06225 [Bacillus pseudomycoides]
MTKLDAFQLTINKDLGELNNKRKELLVKELSGYYEHHDPDAPEGIMFMYNSLENNDEEFQQVDDERIVVSDGLVISSDEITFLKSAEDKKIIDITSITSIVKQVVNTLLLDEDKLGISMELRHSISIEGSAPEKSLELFSTFGINNVKAVGANFLIDEMDYASQFSIKPVVKIEKEFVCTERINYKTDIALEDLEGVITNAIEQFHSREDAVIQS